MLCSTWTLETIDHAGHDEKRGDLGRCDARFRLEYGAAHEPLLRPVEEVRRSFDIQSVVNVALVAVHVRIRVHIDRRRVESVHVQDGAQAAVLIDHNGRFLQRNSVGIGGVAAADAERVHLRSRSDAECAIARHHQVGGVGARHSPQIGRMRRPSVRQRGGHGRVIALAAEQNALEAFAVLATHLAACAHVVHDLIAHALERSGRIAIGRSGSCRCGRRGGLEKKRLRRGDGGRVGAEYDGGVLECVAYVDEVGVGESTNERLAPHLRLVVDDLLVLDPASERLPLVAHHLDVGRGRLVLRIELLELDVQIAFAIANSRRENGRRASIAAGQTLDAASVVAVAVVLLLRVFHERRRRRLLVIFLGQLQKRHTTRWRFCCS